MTFKKSACLSLLMVATSGCSVSADHNSVLSYVSVVDDQHIAVHAPSVPDAVISVSGDLAIGGKDIALDQNQRHMLAEYFASAMSVRKDGVAVGAAGANTAGQALSSVAAGLTGGDPDKIGAQIDASAAKIDVEVTKLCSDLARLHSAQTSIATTLAEFRPYASINSERESDCRAN